MGILNRFRRGSTEVIDEYPSFVTKAELSFKTDSNSFLAQDTGFTILQTPCIEVSTVNCSTGEVKRDYEFYVASGKDYRKIFADLRTVIFPLLDEARKYDKAFPFINDYDFTNIVDPRENGLDDFGSREYIRLRFSETTKTGKPPKYVINADLSTSRTFDHSVWPCTHYVTIYIDYLSDGSVGKGHCAFWDDHVCHSVKFARRKGKLFVSFVELNNMKKADGTKRLYDWNNSQRDLPAPEEVSA